MAVIPTNTKVTLQRRDDTTTDAYGNPLGSFADVATYRAWVERTRYNEPQLDGETDATDFLLLLPGAVTLRDGDRIIYESEAYEIAADPYVQRPPGGRPHHTECRMRPAVVPTLREKAIRQMIDQVLITRETEGTYDENTFVFTPGTPTTVYEGPARIRSRDAYNREAERVDDAVTLQSYTAVIPWDVDGVEDDDVVTVTVTDDPRLLDRSLRVVGVNVTTDNATRVLFLEDNLG